MKNKIRTCRAGDVEDYVSSDTEVCLWEDVRDVLMTKNKEIEELKCKKSDAKIAAHVLKAFNFYRCQLTHCSYDERTAQWIIDNWEQDYDRVEAYK